MAGRARWLDAKVDDGVMEDIPLGPPIAPPNGRRSMFGIRSTGVPAGVDNTTNDRKIVRTFMKAIMVSLVIKTKVRMVLVGKRYSRM